MSLFTRRLQALQFPQYKTFDVSNTLQYRTLVVWLEETKIRVYEIEQRKGLRNVNSEAWNAALSEYLTELECPWSVEANDQQRMNIIMEWLIGQAISSVYSDNAETLNNIKGKGDEKTKTVKRATKSVEVRKPPELDCSSPEFRAKLVSFAQKLGIEKADTMESAVLLNIIRHRVRSSQQSAESKQMTLPEARKQLREISLGFSTGDDVVDDAAKVLRLLYINDLRDLQTAINEITISVQELTADPKTNAKLGKVGR